MTRDTQRLHDEPDLSNDAETYAALWELSPFPRLPDHAPDEIRNLTIDIHDPRRVYTIHQAARRHQFHLLVERYMIQIRYGCQSATCKTTTCFSCRKRLAGGAPVRRYNATSARTLAVYMASQDNPEQELCRNAYAEQPIAKKRISRPKKDVPGDSKTTSSAQDGLTMHGENGGSAKTIVAHKSNSTRSMGNGKAEIKPRKGSEDKASNDSTRSKVQVLDEPTKMDHRSFVQNVFGTTAFKMVEWLTPRNLQRLSAPEDSIVPNEIETSLPKNSGHLSGSSQHQDSRTSEERQEDTPQSKVEPETLMPPVHQEKENIEPTKAQDLKSPILKSKPRAGTNQSLESFPKPTPNEKATPKRKNSHVRTSSEPLEHHKPKNILNLPPKPAEMDTNHYTVKSPRQKVVRQAVLTSPALRVEESPPPDEFQFKSPITAVEAPREPIAVGDSNVDRKPRSNADLELNNNERKDGPKVRKNRKPRSRRNAPQSMAFLSVETIQMLCDIMQSNGISEKHTLHPQLISGALVKELQMPGAGSTTPVKSVTSLFLKSQSDKLQWMQFAEQSFFDVLSRPATLLQSFRRDDKLLDTQAIWYLMLRMTRVSPSLILDSLWRASESLFQAPELLQDMYDWPKHSSTRSIGHLSNDDAAQIIGLCLHALVASAPLVRDARKLANLSRIRSQGLSTRGRDSADEPVDLCLQYDDAFTNDNAMRLARRLFASIPTRHALAELADLPQDSKNISSPKSEILDTVLATLKLDPQTSPYITFTDSENQMHEPRMYVLVLDWARTVMLQEWQGSAVVPRDGPFGGALMTMAAMYKNRKSLLLGDIHFQTQYFSERLDPITMPREWIVYEPNNKTVHLLDYPYLFTPSTLVTYFRSINFSNMNYAYETSKATSGLITTAMAGNHNLMANKQRWERLGEMMRTGTSQFLVLEVRRSNILLDTFNSIWRREERELMRPLKLRLGEDGGEEGMDHGGVQQEFFGLALAEALNPDYGTFTVDERTKMTWFQPGSLEPLWKFELIGTIISLAVYNGLTLPVTFPKALYRRLLDQDVTELHHIEDGWPALANGLTTLLEWKESVENGSVEEIFSRTYEFSVEQFGQTVSREMSPSNTDWPQFSSLHPSATSNPDDAPLVTNENRNSYVSDYIHWLTDVSVRPQFEAFKRGFFTCISPQFIKLFDASTLQSVVEGVQEIDIAELRRVTHYVGWDASHRTVREFWSIVKKYDLDQKRKLLEFVTASDRVPVGGVRNMMFTLQKNGVDDLHLPTSYTCFGILLLPEFSSKEVLKEKLAMALENSRGFGFA